MQHFHLFYIKYMKIAFFLFPVPKKEIIMMYSIADKNAIRSMKKVISLEDSDVWLHSTWCSYDAPCTGN